jgi:hypothetical protein
VARGSAGRPRPPSGSTCGGGRHAGHDRAVRSGVAPGRRVGERHTLGVLRGPGGLGHAAERRPLHAVVAMGVGLQGGSRGHRHRGTRRDLHQPHRRPARSVDSRRGPGVGDRVSDLSLRRGAADHQHVALPAPRLPARRARGECRDADEQRLAGGASLAATSGHRRPAPPHRHAVVDPRACSPTRRGVLALREPTISPTATGTG